LFLLWKIGLDQSKTSVCVKKFLKGRGLHNLLGSVRIFLSTGRIKMSTEEPIENEKDNKQEQNDIHVPFDGFVNVNDIVEKRRSLRSPDQESPDPGPAPETPS
jgi:hypothetical protein